MQVLTGWQSFIRLAASLVGLLPVLAVVAATAPPVRVSTVDGLRAALAVAPAGTDVRLVPGDYPLDAPLKIPDGVALVGPGEMTVDAAGRAAGLRPDPAVTLRLLGDWAGNGIELGDRSSLRRLRVVDESGAGDERLFRPTGRNLVVVTSRRPADAISASIEECELITRQYWGVGPTDPLGRALGVWTRNPMEGGPMHTGATVALSLVRSVVSAPDTNSLFVINFAERGVVEVRIRDSRLEGNVNATGGTSRPGRVTQARTTIDSARTDYLAGARASGVGWYLIGGGGVPHPGFGTPPGADGNELRVLSEGDRILGFTVGVLAAAGRRVGGLSGPSSGNRLDVDLRGLVIRTNDAAGASDVSWYGARSQPGPDGSDPLPPGERNVLTVRVEGVTGSGPRDNRYVDFEGPTGAGSDDAGNRLRVLGSPEQFPSMNPGLSPAPADRFFLDKAH